MLRIYVASNHSSIDFDVFSIALYSLLAGKRRGLMLFARAAIGSHVISSRRMKFASGDRNYVVRLS